MASQASAVTFVFAESDYSGWSIKNFVSLLASSMDFLRTNQANSGATVHFYSVMWRAPAAKH